MAGQTITGKAFEYACLVAFQNRLTENGKAVLVDETDQFHTAKYAYASLSDEQKEKYSLAAQTAVKLIFPLEPKITHGDGDIILSLSSDASGVEGDVRDLVCIRISENWEIGISCKHNHEALKHPRVTQACDFGSDWVGHNCSEGFIARMKTILEPLDGTVRWRDMPDKFDSFYVPILREYCNEISSLCNTYADVPSRLLAYFFGNKDFYKVISQESNRQTKVMGFNMNGTMNKSAGTVRPIYTVRKLHMPTRLIETRFKPGSKTTIILTFDGGWEIKMRIHNKDEKATITSLAWDVSLTGMPPNIYQQQRSWDE